MKLGMKKLVVILMAGLCLGAKAEIDYSPLEPLVVQDGGRKKPYLVFADETALSLSGKRAVPVGESTLSSMELTTRLWLQPDQWDETPLIYVGYLPLKRETGMEESRKLFSYAELAQNREFLALLSEAAATRARGTNVRLTGNLKEAAEVGMRIALFEGLTAGQIFRLQPASGPDWGVVPGNSPRVADLRKALNEGNSEAFTAAAIELENWQRSTLPEALPSDSILKLEVFYQKLHPFRLAWILYLAAGIILATTFTWQARAGYFLGWALAAAGLAFQLFGFVARVFISGRAPVTNMYETVIYVAFGTVLFALIFEAIHRSRFFLLGAAPVAVLSLILADWHPVALDPAITPLVPVLQSNFWLTTHVLTITLSYAAFALALGVSHIPLGQVILGKKPAASLYQYVYRSLQVGVFLLAVGTILGGVWANYSWGRFWDWDPKETWALVALLTYLFILHGRIAGKWGGFGLAVGAVLAFQTIIMAWYGVNFVLGVGLHSYGFGTGGRGYAITFVIIECLIVAAAVWRKGRSGPVDKQTSTHALAS